MSHTKSFKVYGLFLAALAVGIGLQFYPANWWPGREIVMAVREGLIVAGLVGLLVDLGAADALVTRTATQLSERLIGYGLPKPAQELIHELVHETKRVYVNHRVRYKLDRIADAMVRVTVTYEFDVVNNGSTAERYKPKLELEGLYNPKLIRMQFSGKSVAMPPKNDPDTGVVTFEPSKEVRLRPSKPTDLVSDLAENQVCSVVCVYTQEMPERYSDVISFGGIAIHPHLEADIPEGFEFHSDRHGSNACTHLDGSLTWDYKRAFIGKQHIRVWWKPIGPA